MLTDLGRKPGMLGVVFRRAQNRIQDPAKARRLIVDLIDRESWLTLWASTSNKQLNFALAQFEAVADSFARGVEGGSTPV